MYGARDRARTRAVEVMDVMDVITFRMRPDDHGSRPMPEMC